ncbi:hypothetical protein [Streptomyces fulvorobeus]|uniref:Peptidase inhibitor family I36 n=1 Tax=Streptomyces fulvorobeus TaxID=284028 RepID=A0A7J0CEU8_9ACTN|nr:hypothetical protein [Streptomyces fulvorobeus]NYE44487.1 hypothetical protein [Streptomyces fulvorobeus]GFN01021.1 hypothetical protein Sfulv_58310 [Streptomyces fulvorobeus]
MKLNRKLAATLLTSAGLAATLTPLTASPASAASMHGCSYPRVCVYNGSYSDGTIIGWFQDTYYQNMPSEIRNDADAAVNTRNDDSVWLIDTGATPDAYICIPRNTAVNLGNYAHPNGTTWANDVDTIKIFGDPDDGKCNGTYQVQQGRVPANWP